jgi:hypothetical protein
MTFIQGKNKRKKQIAEKNYFSSASSSFSSSLQQHFRIDLGDALPPVLAKLW